MKIYDVIIIGAGAAGLSAAGAAIARGKTVLIVDMGKSPARKIFVSGGGRCNFTNMAASVDRYFGKNSDFIRSALARVKPIDILEWATNHNIEFFQKAPGQFFTKSGSMDIINALLSDANGADFVFNTEIKNIERIDSGFIVNDYKSKSVIIATGGLSYKNLGVSDFGMVFAKKIGHKIVPISPGLVGLKTGVFDADLSGISLNVKIKSGKKSISDSLLFTHFGIGGPAAYRASMFDLSNDFIIDFAPEFNVAEFLIDKKRTNGKRLVGNILSLILPSRLADWFCQNINRNISDIRDTELKSLGDSINNFKISDLKPRGLDWAEVMLGGISTEHVSSKTMESDLCPGLFFAGEVLDITGDLGGFNLHFAFASGRTAGNNA